MQAHIKLFCQLRRLDHQLFGHAKRRARSQSDAHHCTVLGVVMLFYRELRFGQNYIVVLHHVVWRQAAVFFRKRHRAASWMKPHSQINRRGNFCREQIPSALRMHIQMVCACRASRQCQFGKTNPRRNMRRLFIQRAPQRIQRLQPAEQRCIGHWWKRASEVLIHVVMRVHQTWGDKTICCVDNARCYRLRA